MSIRALSAVGRLISIVKVLNEMEVPSTLPLTFRGFEDIICSVARTTGAAQTDTINQRLDFS